MAKKSQPQIARSKKTRFAFITDIVTELRKAVWPTRQETLRLTIMVIIVCLIVGLFLGGVDYGFAELVSRVFLGG